MNFVTQTKSWQRIFKLCGVFIKAMWVACGIEIACTCLWLLGIIPMIWWVVSLIPWVFCASHAWALLKSLDIMEESE